MCIKATLLNTFHWCEKLAHTSYIHHATCPWSVSILCSLLFIYCCSWRGCGRWPAANEWLLQFTQVQPSHVFYSSVWQRRYLIKWTEQIFLLSFNNYSDLYLCSCSSAPGHTWLLSWTRDIHDTGVVLLRHTISKPSTIQQLPFTPMVTKTCNHKWRDCMSHTLSITV